MLHKKPVIGNYTAKISDIELEIAIEIDWRLGED